MIEVCVDTMAQALAAERQGAQRIELCARLDLDGLTPDRDFIQQALRDLSIPIHVMIRPRGGNFVYTAEEVEQMKADILFCKAAGAPGVVFGALRPDGSLDLPLIRELAELASPMNVVIHKAIDQTPDPVSALKELLTLDPVNYVLTSGGAPTALEGTDKLKQMTALAGNAITIIAAGKITKDNLTHIRQVIGAKDYHGRLIVGTLEE